MKKDAENFRLDIIKDVTRGMAHLSTEKILHKDLAARNVRNCIEISAKFLETDS